MHGQSEWGIVGDFNCQNVRWEEMEVNGNAGPWSEEMLQLAMRGSNNEEQIRTWEWLFKIP